MLLYFMIFAFFHFNTCPHIFLHFVSIFFIFILVFIFIFCKTLLWSDCTMLYISTMYLFVCICNKAVTLRSHILQLFTLNALLTIAILTTVLEMDALNARTGFIC